MTPERFPCGKQIGSYVGPQDYKRALAVDAEKKENGKERKRKTLFSDKRKCAQKEFDRADIVRDIRKARSTSKWIISKCAVIEPQAQWRRDGLHARPAQMGRRGHLIGGLSWGFLRTWGDYFAPRCDNSSRP